MSYVLLSLLLLLLILYYLYDSKKVIEGMSLETLTEKNLHNMTYLSENLSNLEKVYNESFSKYNIAPRVDQVEKKIERLNEILTKDIPTKINNIREKSGLGEDLDDSQRWENPPDLRIQSDKDIKAGYKKNKKKKFYSE